MLDTTQITAIWACHKGLFVGRATVWRSASETGWVYGLGLLGEHQANAEASLRRRTQLTVRSVLHELDPGEGLASPHEILDLDLYLEGSFAVPFEHLMHGSVATRREQVDSEAPDIEADAPGGEVGDLISSRGLQSE